MRCTHCHGTGVIECAPCADCGGYGQLNCCEGLREQPAALSDRDLKIALWSVWAPVTRGTKDS